MLHNIYPRLNQPDGRIYLVDEYFSYLTEWQTGAIDSAWIQIQTLYLFAGPRGWPQPALSLSRCTANGEGVEGISKALAGSPLVARTTLELVEIVLAARAAGVELA